MKIKKKTNHKQEYSVFIYFKSISIVLYSKLEFQTKVKFSANLVSNHELSKEEKAQFQKFPYQIRFV